MFNHQFTNITYIVGIKFTWNILLTLSLMTSSSKMGSLVRPTRSKTDPTTSSISSLKFFSTKLLYFHNCWTFQVNCKTDLFYFRERISVKNGVLYFLGILNLVLVNLQAFISFVVIRHMSFNFHPPICGIAAHATMSD